MPHKKHPHKRGIQADERKLLRDDAQAWWLKKQQVSSGPMPLGFSGKVFITK